MLARVGIGLYRAVSGAFPQGDNAMYLLTESVSTRSMTGLPRTLFIALAARAQAARSFPSLDPHDDHAQRLLQASGAEVQTSPADSPTVMNVLWRTQLIKQLGQEFFEHYPHSTGVNLGSGLAHYFQWLDNGSNRWIDVDLPEVIELRDALIPTPPARCQHKALDITSAGWWKRLGLHHHNEPVLLVCEGVLMYLQPAQVRSFLREIGENAPEGSELLCDFISPVGIGQSALADTPEHPQAVFTWGAHNGQELANFHPRLELLSQHSATEALGWGGSLAEMVWAPLVGGPLYGLAQLRVSDD
jgi:O-methyltransferase involved in polyketide biosynthesis